MAFFFRLKDREVQEALNKLKQVTKLEEQDIVLS